MPRFLCAVLTLCLAITTPTLGALRAGAAAVDVTPPELPVVVNGGFLARVADKVVAPLYARAVVLDDGQTKLAIVVVDSCMVPRDALDRAKQLAAERTDIPPAHMLIGATHTHSAPSAFGALGSPEDAKYPAFLVQRIADAIVQAASRLEAAEVGVAVVDADRFTALRRWVLRPDKVRNDPFGNPTVRASMHTAANPNDAVGPTGPEDPDLSVISVRSADGRPIALVANFANHYVGAPMLSPDYFGMFADRIGGAIGAEGDESKPFVGMMSQGTSGDVWLRDYFQPDAGKWSPNIETYTDGMVQLAAQAYRSIEHRSDVTLAMAEAELTLKRRTPDAQRLEWARHVVEAYGEGGPKNQTDVYASSALKLHENPTSTLKLQALRIGDFAVTAIPNEVYALTGLKLKRLSPLSPTVNIELANGAEGYIPPPEQYVLGGYNTWPAMSAGLEEAAEPKIVEVVATLLEQVAQKRRRAYAPGVGPAAQAVIDSKPAAYWRMHEWEGPAAQNAVAGADAVYEDGVVFFLEGPAGDRFHATGEDAAVNRAAHFAGGRMRTRVPDLGETYSVELWFWNGMVTDARPVTGYLLSRGREHAPQAVGDHVGLGGTHGEDLRGKLFFYNGDEMEQVLTGTTAIERWTWHHVVFVRDGEKVRVYLDGKPEIEGEAAVTLPSDVERLFIGGRNDGFANWEGRIDEVAVYDRALGADEIAAHYHAAVSPEKSTARRDADPRSPQETIAVTHLRDGYVMQLVAAEPLVQDPVAIDWGPDGKLWVVEMADYPLGMTNDEKDMTPGARVRFLEDNDGDGIYDSSTLFADGLNFANGVLVWGDGVLVTATTDILYLEDTDGDGRADVREPRFTGFVAGNPQLRVNGLRSGLDNWVYVANGLHNKATIKSTKTGQTLDITGRDVRIRPDTGEMEPAAGPSQFGRAMNDWGEWFGVDNSRPIWHVVIEDRYLRRNPHAALPDPRKMLIEGRNPPVFPRSRFIKRYDHPHRGSLLTSACSTIVYRDELLFDRERQHGFTCEPYHNTVLHMTLEPDGVSYTAQLERGADGKSEFIASEDGWFRPVQVRTGPDGALWVVDMYRYLIEHPQFMPEGSREQLRPFFRMGADRGRIYRVFRRDTPPRTVEPLADASTERLVAELESPNGTRRDLAQRMLVKRGDRGAAGVLATLAGEGDDPRARIHALSTLDALGVADDAQLTAALADPHPRVRQNAVRFAESRQAAQGGGQIDAGRWSAAFEDAAPIVRMQAAAAAGAFPTLDAGRTLGRVLRGDHADPYIRAAALSSLGARPAALAPVVEALDVDGAYTADLWRELAATAIGTGNFDTAAAILERIVAQQSGDDVRAALVAVMPVVRRDGKMLSTVRADDELMRRIVAQMEAARRLAGAADASMAQRVAAVELLGGDPFEVELNVARLGELVTPAQPPEIQEAAVRALGASGHGRVAEIVLEKWAGAGPTVRGAMLEVMLARGPWALAILDAVEGGQVDAASIGPAHRERLLASRDGKIKARAAQVLAAGESSRGEVVKAHAEALDLSADVQRGAAVFAKACAVCHRVGEVGTAVGPDLMSVTDRSGPAMLEAILDPNRAIEPRYMAYVVATTDGATVLGLVKSESGASVTLVDATGKEHTLARTQIASMASLNRSLMPEGLEAALTRQELADVIRFLQTGGE